VLLAHERESRERDELRLGEHGALLARIVVELHAPRAPLRKRLEQKLLRGDPVLYDLEGALVDDVVIGRDLSADDDLAESPRRFDHDVAGFAGGRVGGEDDAGLQRADHLLDDDGHRHLGGHTAGESVIEDACAERRRPAAPDRIGEGIVATYAEHALEHPGERVLGGVLGGGGRPHGHERITGAGRAPREPRVGDVDRREQIARQRHGDDRLAQLRRDALERGGIVDLDRAQERVDPRPDAGRLPHPLVRGDGENEARWHRQIGAQHLAEVRALAPDRRNVAAVHVGQVDDEALRRQHRSARRRRGGGRRCRRCDERGHVTSR
jgi:hypothetical protein